MASSDQAEQLRAADEIYERYARPLEQAHWGKFAAINPDGTVVLADTLGEVVLKAGELLGTGNFIFKIGDVVVGSIR